jgi:hypothetical protein
LQEFLLWNKWDIPDFTSDEEDLETFEMEKQDVAKQIQRLQVKYPDKKFPEIRWRFIQFESEYFWRGKWMIEGMNEWVHYAFSANLYIAM